MASPYSTSPPPEAAGPTSRSLPGSSLRVVTGGLAFLAALLCLAAPPPAVGQDTGRPGPADPHDATDPYNAIEPAILEVDVPALIHVRSPEDVARVRKELIAFIWKNDGQLPTTSNVKASDADLPAVFPAGLASCEELMVSMEGNFRSVVYHFRPQVPSKRLMIFHQGHADLWNSGAVETVAFFLARDFSVLAVQMPLMGDNKALAPPGMQSHDDMARLASADVEPIRFFVEPLVASLNYAVEKHAYEDIVMIGLSGGGWTTTLYAAIDPRVRVSFPVAGSLPLYLRVGNHHGERDRGDWEQFYPALYETANYLDLYVLGSSGSGRRQRQVLNKYDSCCFAGVRYTTYERHIQNAVASTGSGHFDVFLDESHRSHLISNEALENAVEPLIHDR